MNKLVKVISLILILSFIPIFNIYAEEENIYVKIKSINGQKLQVEVYPINDDTYLAPGDLINKKYTFFNDLNKKIVLKYIECIPSENSSKDELDFLSQFRVDIQETNINLSPGESKDLNINFVFNKDANNTYQNKTGTLILRFSVTEDKSDDSKENSSRYDENDSEGKKNSDTKDNEEISSYDNWNNTIINKDNITNDNWNNTIDNKDNSKPKTGSRLLLNGLYSIIFISITLILFILLKRLKDVKE